ncbi:GntP family permease [Corynebacterium ammoniagenes]|uniref:Gluconate permease n=2 Tax=Corynebacterium ammoniagenes TaxID=1697 RepID=A0AAV5G2W7_CORAM|nr:SLC13 family permease [Corynebacterium ammoniagenes]APT82794.1 gluconate transporter [Corynebacterium ammoniagenes DSM 20306]AQS73846.1 gluconate transporter [Corynebacterium ammoniagenes]EFG80785.1 GntP family permease [Corynebacterium ammoniagenes DSM 20306]GJN42958.1 gluconate permease [Corynebacterium ammoniagenes]
MVAVHTLIAIVAVVLLIIRFKVDPVISLVLGSLYLGIATGVGLGGTIEAITTGFGEIMIEVGLLIGFGVLIGALMQSTGAFTRLVRLLVNTVGAERLPYSMAALLSLVMPSIYVDVQVVLAAPVARSAAPSIGKHGLPLMASALGTGIFSGYVFVIPGLAALSVTGLMGISLGKWLFFGLVLGPATALVTTFIMRLVLRTNYWKPDSDENAAAQEEFAEARAVAAEASSGSAGTGSTGSTGSAGGSAGASGPGSDDEGSKADQLPLVVLFLPILVPLVLIALGAFADLFEFSNSIIAFLGDANIALFIGLLGAYILTRMTTGNEATSETMQSGFGTTGEILLITGVGGSLGAVIGASGLDSVLENLFTANENMPTVAIVVLAWFVAALLHLAIGSVSVAAIAAAGIIAPVLGVVAVNPIVMGLAIASGAMFALQVNSNFFWMFKSLLGLTTKGALKTMTVSTAISSLVSLPVVIILAMVMPV